MAIQEMAFVPATGWNDPTTFPEKVSNASDVRDMLQLLHDETKDYLNDVVKPAIDNLQAGTIPTGKIENGAVTTDKLANSAVTNAKLGSKAVKQANIDDLAVGTGQIAAKAVTAAKIADATITATQIANTTITGAKMVNGTVTSTQLSSTSGSEAVATGNIRASAVTDAKIASGITGSKISGALSNATIDASKITSGTLSMDRIGSKAVTAAKIADATITATQIANTTITGGKLANGTVTATQLASNAVETAKIKDGNVTDAKIASGITGSKVSGALSNATLDGSKITSGTVAIARLPYETTLSPTLDTKLPTSKAVATYSNLNIVKYGTQVIEVVPLVTTKKYVTASSSYSKSFPVPVSFANVSRIRLRMWGPGFAFPYSEQVPYPPTYQPFKVQLVGKNSGGTAVAVDLGYSVPATPIADPSNPGSIRSTLFFDRNYASNGSSFAVPVTTGSYSEVFEAAITGFPYIITGINLVRTLTSYTWSAGGVVAELSCVV